MPLETIDICSYKNNEKSLCTHVKTPSRHIINNNKAM